QGKKFRIVLVAQSYDLQIIQEMISNYQTLGSELHRFVKQSKNEQESHADSQGITLTEGSSISNTKGNSQSQTSGTSTSSSDSITHTSSGFRSIFEKIPFTSNRTTTTSTSFSENNSKTTSTNQSRTNSRNESTSKNKNTTTTDTLGITYDEINKSAEYCESLIDTYIERFQKGLNHGMWNSSLYIQAENEVVLSELEHTLKSVYSGDESYYESIRFSNNLIENKDINIETLPMLYFDKDIKHPIHPTFVGFSSAINTEELSILSALPNNDLDGLSVSKISSFGLTQSKSIDKYKSIEIGAVLNKKKPTNQRFKLSTEALNSHLFVSGITGSGKSNTIKLILNELQSKNIEKKIPFLVIEPAKSEYKHLLKTIPNLQIFRPGAKDDIFKFNPFIFEHNKNNKSVTLTKHVDMLKTSFSSAFPMYGPMPYILEDAIHKIYEDKGWNFNTEDNPLFTNSNEANYDRMTLLFPSMEDLSNKIESVVDESGYAGELDSNIKAALKTRIKNLTIGAKGKIFNSRHSFDSKILFEKPTVIELSSIVDDEEKAFLMGLLLNKLYQYREEQGSFNELKHITVIEEAHRLLPNISLDKSSEEANSKAKAVETFTNILAEIRSYGEGIIIADQIASKLHSDVIKNTNVKIIQRTMDREDRELVGNSINLNEDQILDIAELKPGEAIVHNKDVHQAFMVNIDKITSEKINDKKLEKLNKDFLDRYSDYRYELIQEHRFYVPKEKLLLIKGVNKEILKTSMLKLINSLYFDENKVIYNWNKFKGNIKNIKNSNVYFYLAIDALKEFGYISNIQYYKDVDSYLDVYKCYLRLINSLIIGKKEGIKKSIEAIKEATQHENIKEVFPSMKHYNDFEVDYTLLLLENITSDEEVYNFINSTMQENIALNERFDKILNKVFKATSPELRYSLGAIRSGTKEINLNIIAKEGF
ncbi:MAG: ATP-binding protein, partial [Campylobacterota bacterium]|nr:ATP-binding protein [Campylobacterota bacterium]